MLYLYEPLQLEDVRGNTVTVYPDSHRQDTFYPIPNVPRFRRDADGKPVFRLIKFRGGDASSAPHIPVQSETEGGNDVLPAGGIPTLGDEIAGGFLFFDVEFSLDEDTKEKIRGALYEHVRQRYAARGQSLPEGFQINLQQPRWTDGTVELLMEDASNGLFESVSKTGKPSLMGNNVSSIAAVLQPWQATLIEQAFTQAGGFSPLQVNYNLKFMAKLPPVRINIYASAYDQYTMYKEYGNHPNRGACSNRDKVVRGISERVYARDAVRINIDSGGLTLEDESYKALHEFAMSQLDQWIQREFLQEPPERATKEDLQNFTLKRLSESEFRNFSLNITQSASVEVPIHPQGTLEALVDGDDDLSEFIIEVDLDTDEFYQNRNVSVKVYADFPSPEEEPTPSDLLFVEVTLRYGENEQTHTWDATGSANMTANGGRWDVEWHKIPDVTEVEWASKAVFRDLVGSENRSIAMSGKTNSNELNIPVALPGRVFLQLREEGVPWEIIQYVHAKVEYVDSAADPRHLVKELVIDGESDEVVVNEVIWTERTKPFQVTVTYHYKNGTVKEESTVNVDSDLFVIETPIERWLTTSVFARYVNTDWDFDEVRFEYRDPLNDYIYEGRVELSETGGPRQEIVIPLIEKEREQFRFHWVRRYKDGAIFSSGDYSGAPADGWHEAMGAETLFTGHVEDESGDMLRVQVDPLIFLVYGGAPGDGELIRARVHLSRLGSDDVDDHIFTNRDGPWTWREFIADPEMKEYQWWAEYYTRNPFRVLTVGSKDNPIDSNNESIILIPPGM